MGALNNALSLISGLVLFLFGMHIMGEALEKRAGNQLKGILSKLTASKFKGLLLGMGVTAIIQSSSATTVMVVGFVNSGIMNLNQAISVIMGANIGTTITAWILSLTGLSGESIFVQILKPSFFTPVLALVGIIFYMFLHDSKKKDTGLILLGFSTLMFGMETMSAAVKPLADVPEFGEILLMFSNPLLGVAAGAVITAIIQSSSASVGILQALSATGKLTVGSAIPIIMGQNIGTCITAIISSVGATKNAKRAAAVHLYFNIVGTAVILSVFCISNAIFKFGFTVSGANEFNIALIHTAFNLLCTTILYPFSEKLEKLAVATVRDSKKKESVQELDERLLATPSIAIDRCRVAVDSMAATSVDALNKAFGLFDKFDEKIIGEIDKDEDTVDKYEDMIGSYLVELSAKSMTAEDSKEVTKYLHTIGDLERLSDHAVNLARSLDEMNDKKLSFSAQAKSDLTVMFNAVKEILGMTYDCLIHNDVRKAALVEPLEQVIDTLKADIKKGHIKRLQNEECTIEMGFILSDVITNLERISDHCSNIAGCIIELSSNNSLSVHEYLHEVKDGTGSTSSAFRENYEIYLKKYHLA